MDGAPVAAVAAGDAPVPHLYAIRTIVVGGLECVPLKIITDDAEYLDNGTMDAVGMALPCAPTGRAKVWLGSALLSPS